MILLTAVFVTQTVSSISTVFVRPWANIATCDFGGAEIEILRKALETQNWVETKDFSFVCIPTDTDLGEKLGNFTTAVAVGGLVINSTVIRIGGRYSVPTFKSGLSMMILSQTDPGFWFVFSPLSVGSWALFLLTPVLIGLTNFWYQVIASDDRRTAIKEWREVGKLIWTGYAKMFVLRAEATDFGGLALGAMVVLSRLMMLCYICSFAAIEFERMNCYVKKVQDITEKFVYVPLRLRQLTSEYSLTYYPQVPGPLDDPVQLLQRGIISVYIDDHAKLCSLAGVGGVEIITEMFDSYSYGVLLGSETDPAFVSAINVGLSVVRETTKVVDVLDQYGLVNIPDLGNSTQLNLIDVSGLFFIFGICVTLSLFLSFLPFPHFLSASWHICLPRLPSEFALTTVNLKEMTARTETIEGLEMVPTVGHKATTTEVSFTLEDLASSPANEDFNMSEHKSSFMDSNVSEETMELIRTTTLMLLLFEASFVEGIDKFRELVESEETRKSQLAEVISEFQ